MNSTKSELVIAKITEGSSVSELISSLRCSFQQKEYDEVERLLICREEKFKMELDDLKRDFNSISKVRDSLERSHCMAELNRLTMEQDLKICKHEYEKAREQLNRLREDYDMVVENLKKVENEKKTLFDEVMTEKNKMIDKLISEKRIVEETLALRNSQLQQFDGRVSILEESIAKLLAVDVLDIRRGSHCQGADVEVEGDFALSSAAMESSVNRNLSNGTDTPAFEGENDCFDVENFQNGMNDHIEGENGGSGVEKLQNGSNRHLEKMTLDAFSNGLGDVRVSPTPHFPHDATRSESPDLPVEALTSTNMSCSNEMGVQKEIVLETESSSEAAALCIPVSKGPGSPVIVEISDSEESPVDVPVFCATEVNSIGKKTPLQEEDGSECVKDSRVDSMPKRKRSMSDCDDICNSMVARRETKDSAFLCHDGKGSLVSERSMELDLMSAGHKQTIWPTKRSHRTVKRCQEKVGSDDGGGSRKLFCYDSDDSSGNEDDTCFDSYMDNFLARLQSYLKNNWKFAADMRSAFEKDNELCMKAVCALYRKKISAEKSIINSSIPGDIVFSHFDAMSGKALAEYLIDGDPQNKLKKTVLEVEQEDSKVLSKCKDLAIQYCDQLFDIYSKNEDRFFRPGL